MDCYDLGTLNKQAKYKFVSSVSPISNNQVLSPSLITRGATITILQAHAILGYDDEFIEDDLPSCSFPNLQDSSRSFSDIEENMASWGSSSAESGNMDTEVAMFTPAFLGQPTGPSMSDFVDP